MLIDFFLGSVKNDAVEVYLIIDDYFNIMFYIKNPIF